MAEQPQPPDNRGEREPEMGQPRRRRSPIWSQDPTILARLETVEAMYLDGYSNAAIAAAVGTSRPTVQRDIQRLERLWLKRVEAAQDTLRGRAHPPPGARLPPSAGRRRRGRSTHSGCAVRPALHGPVPGRQPARPPTL